MKAAGVVAKAERVAKVLAAKERAAKVRELAAVKVAKAASDLVDPNDLIQNNLATIVRGRSQFDFGRVANRPT